MNIQDTKGYTLSLNQQINGLIDVILHLEDKLGHQLPEEHPLVKKLFELQETLSKEEEQ